jgi:actin-like ATPase involved in cell morphogenesis
LAINKVNGRIGPSAGCEGHARQDAGNIVIKPMKDGVIADFEITEEDAHLFIKGAQPERLVRRES